MSVRCRKVVQKSFILEVPWTRLANRLAVGDEGKGEIGHETPGSLDLCLSNLAMTVAETETGNP